MVGKTVPDVLTTFQQITRRVFLINETVPELICLCNQVGRAILLEIIEILDVDV